MGKRGPKSANAAKKAVNQPKPAYLSSIGRNLGPAERAEWDRRVKAKEPGFYREDDAGLLVQLCQAVSDRNQLRRLKTEALEGKDVKLAATFQAQWIKTAFLIAALSRQLKIGASARETHRATAKASRAGLPEARSPRAGLMYGEAEAAQADRLN